jgi:hypothetical protein
MSSIDYSPNHTYIKITQHDIKEKIKFKNSFHVIFTFDTSSDLMNLINEPNSSNESNPSNESNLINKPNQMDSTKFDPLIIFCPDDMENSYYLIIKKLSNNDFICSELDINLFRKKQIILNHNYYELKTICELNGMALEFVQTLTYEICKLAIQNRSEAIQYVMHDHSILSIIIKQNYPNIDEICKIAVQIDGLALQYIENQTDEICILAVQQDGMALEFVKSQTEEICKLAVKNDNLVLYHYNPKLLIQLKKIFADIIISPLYLRTLLPSTR